MKRLQTGYQYRQKHDDNKQKCVMNQKRSMAKKEGIKKEVWPEHCVKTAQKDTKTGYQYRQRHDDNKQKCVMNQTADQMKA